MVPGLGRCHMPQGSWSRAPQPRTLCSRVWEPRLSPHAHSLCSTTTKVTAITSQENTLVTASTHFQKHERWLYKWTSPGGQYWNQIDYILCSQRWRSSVQSSKRSGADCGSDHELLIAKFRPELKKLGKTTRWFRYDLNQIPYDYPMEVMKRFEGLDLVDKVPEELWVEVHNTAQEAETKTIPKKKRCNKPMHCVASRHAAFKASQPRDQKNDKNDMQQKNSVIFSEWQNNRQFLFWLICIFLVHFDLFVFSSFLKWTCIIFTLRKT